MAAAFVHAAPLHARGPLQAKAAVGASELLLRQQEHWCPAVPHGLPQHVACALKPGCCQQARESSFAVAVICGAALASLAAAVAQRLRSQRRSQTARGRRGLRRVALAAADETVSTKKRKSEVPEDIDWNSVSNEWEVDCFSRPVLWDGKKLWELMVTDANGVYRRVAQMKPTRVNSVVVQKLMKIFIDESKVKPRVIRFFRKVMKNMLTVALNGVIDSTPALEKTKIIPSRNCWVLRLWLSYREREVYPKMENFIPSPQRKTASVQASMVRMTYEALPETLRFSKYAISAIPLGAIGALKPGQMPGKMCRVPPQCNDMSLLVHGLVILTSRADFMVTVLKSMELAAVRLDLDTNELLMDMGIDTTYRIEKVKPEDKDGCIEFERAKRQMAGLHFVAIHNNLTGGDLNLPKDENQRPGDGCISGLWLLTDYAPQDEQ